MASLARPMRLGFTSSVNMLLNSRRREDVEAAAVLSRQSKKDEAAPWPGREPHGATRRIVFRSRLRGETLPVSAAANATRQKVEWPGGGAARADFQEHDGDDAAKPTSSQRARKAGIEFIPEFGDHGRALGDMDL